MEKIQELQDKLHQSIKQTITEKRIGIAFSGGVDSSLLAKLCSDLGYDITLLTIGFSNSHDIIFAKEINNIFKFPHKVLEIDPASFNKISSDIKNKIKTDDLSWNENCIAFYYVSKLANSINLNTVVTANGIDELFCGYNAYREAIKIGETKVLELMNSKIDNELKMMKAVNLIGSEFGVKFLQPMLSLDFIEYAKTIKISEKITGEDDLLRKHIVRELAKKVQVPTLAVNKRKKALQYGSLIHKTLIKSR